MVEGKTLQNNKNRKKTITILLVLVMLFLVIARFSIWHTQKVETEYDGELVFTQIESYGLYYGVHDINYSPSNPSEADKYYYDETIDYYADIVTEDAPIITYLKSLQNTDLLCILTIIISALLLVVWLVENKKNENKKSMILSVVLAILIIIMLLQFVFIYPYIEGIESSSFNGSSVTEDYAPQISYRNWGPSLGMYFPIASFILLITIIINLAKLTNGIEQRPEQVGGETDRLSED